jgi:hypothetical protein
MRNSVRYFISVILCWGLLRRCRADVSKSVSAAKKKMPFVLRFVRKSQLNTIEGDS